MAKLTFGMNVSLDGYVNHDLFAPDAALFQHFVDHVAGLAGSLYGRRLYEVMRVWDDGWPEQTEAEKQFGEAWRNQHKWVVSRSLTSLGPNATLVRDDLEATVRRLKVELDGELDLGGPELAAALGELGLVDEYHLYVHPVVVGGGKPYFVRARPPLRLVDTLRIGAEAIRLTYAPA